MKQTSNWIWDVGGGEGKGRAWLVREDSCREQGCGGRDGPRGYLGKLQERWPRDSRAG